MKKTSFVFYKSQYEIISTLPKEIRIELYDSIMNFAFFGKKPESIDMMFLALFKVFEDQITRDQLKFDETCKKRAESGKLGGRPKIENQTKAKKANGFSEKQNNPDNENENDNENDNIGASPFSLSEKEMQEQDELWKSYPDFDKEAF